MESNRTTSSNVTYLPISSEKLPNPFRPGSKKARCFDLYRAGGQRAQLIEEMRKLGVAWSTARTWLNIFHVYARGVREARKSAATQNSQQPER
jgi:hypothetical protein